MPFTKTEKRILIFNKVKKGIPYEEAKKQVEDAIALCIINNEKTNKKEEQETSDFKESFQKMKYGTER